MRTLMIILGFASAIALATPVLAHGERSGFHGGFEQHQSFGEHRGFEGNRGGFEFRGGERRGGFEGHRGVGRIIGGILLGAPAPECVYPQYDVYGNFEGCYPY